MKKVGVNCFVEEEEEEEREVEFHPYRGEEARKQVERLETVRAERDDDAVARPSSACARPRARGST